MIEKRFEVGWRNHAEQAVHVVMSKTAQLGAHNFVLTDLIGRKVHRNDHAGQGILLQAQFPDKEIVNDVLRTQQQLDRPMYGNDQFGSDDVVPAGRIVRIDAERVAGGRAHKAGIDPAEFPIPTWIAKGVDKLVGGPFDLDGARSRTCESGICPGFATQNPQANKNEQREGRPEDFQADISTDEARLLAAIAKTNHCVGQA